MSFFSGDSNADDDDDDDNDFNDNVSFNVMMMMAMMIDHGYSENEVVDNDNNYADNDNHVNTEQHKNDQWSSNMLFVELFEQLGGDNNQQQ